MDDTQLFDRFSRSRYVFVINDNDLRQVIPVANYKFCLTGFHVAGMCLLSMIMT